jgi:hypothetical protein
LFAEAPRPLKAGDRLEIMKSPFCWGVSHHTEYSDDEEMLSRDAAVGGITTVSQCRKGAVFSNRT